MQNLCKRPSIKYVCKILQNTKTSNLLIHTSTCGYQGVRNFSFSKYFAYVLNGWPVTLNFSVKHMILLLFYRGWLGRHGYCYNTSTKPSFLITLTSFLNTWPNFSNSRSSSWFSVKTSKAQRISVWKTWPRVLKQILGWAFCRKEFLRILSVKSKIYLLKYNLIVCNLSFTNNSWSYSLSIQ